MTDEQIQKDVDRYARRFNASAAVKTAIECYIRDSKKRPLFIEADVVDLFTRALDALEDEAQAGTDIQLELNSLHSVDGIPHTYDLL